jgi:hypothetical protein
MASKIGILSVIISEEDEFSPVDVYLGAIKSCDGVDLHFKGLNLIEMLKLNEGALPIDQLEDLANDRDLHQDMILDIDAKKFVFAPLGESRELNNSIH